MNKEQGSKDERSDKMIALCSALPESPQSGAISIKVGELRAELAGVRQTASEKHAVRTESTMYSTTKRELRRGLIQDHLIHLKNSAAALEVEIPGISKMFRVPGEHGREADFVARVNGLIKNAREFETQFIALGAPGDFIFRIEEARNVYLNASSNRRKVRNEKREISARIDEGLEKCDNLCRYLYAMVRREFQNDAGVMAALKTAFHVDAPTGVRRKSEVKLLTAGEKAA